jgi:hypothetical protein
MVEERSPKATSHEGRERRRPFETRVSRARLRGLGALSGRAGPAPPQVPKPSWLGISQITPERRRSRGRFAPRAPPPLTAGSSEMLTWRRAVSAARAGGFLRYDPATS